MNSIFSGTVYHNNRHGCQKCEIVGTHSKVSNTTIFPTPAEIIERTDEEFRHGFYPTVLQKDEKLPYHDHYNYYDVIVPTDGPIARKIEVRIESPLLQIPFFDIIKDVIVSEPLHIIHAGLIKRYLAGWKDGTKAFNIKWNNATSTKISQKLLQIKLPAEIHRPVRTLDNLAHWKGSELASFLNYIGIVVLKEELPADDYYNFMVLFCIVTIYSTNHYRHLFGLARSLTRHFVENYDELHGHHLTSNTHNILHMSDEVERFGPLPTLSAYPFENILGQIKKKLRHGRYPLVQAANRFTELTTNSVSFEGRNRKKGLKFSNI